MEKYLTGTKRQMDDASETNKIKCDSNDEAYLALGFTVNVMGDEERPVCILFLKTDWMDG